MASFPPLLWRREGHANVWSEVDSFVYLDIVDEALANKYHTITLPSVGNTVEVRSQLDTAFWRERSIATGELVRGGAVPFWVLVSVTWEIV